VPARWRAIGLETQVPFDAVAGYARRSIWRVTDETHATVLGLIDDLLAINARAESGLPGLAAEACRLPRIEDPTRLVGAAHAR
jgi:hypothetical protein